MPDAKTKYENMLFNYETTNKSDFQRPDFKPHVSTKDKEKPKLAAIRPKPLKDIHTLSEWKTQAIPFGLLHKARPIVGTSPWTVQKKYEKITADDAEREQVIKTRPRLVIAPAVRMDDIEDPVARRILCEDMYTSETQNQRGTVVARCNVQAPFSTYPAPANPVTLRKLQARFVSPEWRIETVNWDKKQLRSHCDTSKEFWLATKPPKCRACDETAVVKAHRGVSLQHRMQ